MNKFESSSVVKSFRKHGDILLKKNNPVVVGVSGGPDSMALLYILHRLAVPAVVVHCNYQLRGRASDTDQDLVEQICILWEMECVAVRFDTMDEEGHNFQDWARDERYRIFRDIKKEAEADYILTAHHRDDQIETIFQKILRGAGLAAWKGMSVYEGDLYRPLLEVSKADIMKFVQDLNVPYRIDNSNEESTYARNFLRLQWFPALNKLFPGWNENILKLPDRASEFLVMSDYILNNILESERQIHREKFLKLPTRLHPIIFHRFIQNINPDIHLTAGMLSEVNKLIVLQTGGSMKFTEGCTIVRNRDVFEWVDPDLNENREVLQLTMKDLQQGIKEEDIYILIEKFEGVYKKGILLLDAEKLRFPVDIRPWKEGDNFQPLGMSGSQLVSDHLTNRKIKASEKSLAKVVESFDGTICAVIFPHSVSDGQIGTISELVKCTPGTKKTMSIRKTD